MSEKLKPNFTPVPNVILDEIMRTLAPGATKVLFAICRYTYGWGKPQGDRISLKQLREITGMARGSVVRSVKELGPFVTVTVGDPSRQLASEYRINVEISDDDLVLLRDQQPVSKRDQASLLASLPGETFQRKSKKRRNPHSFSPIIERVIRRLNELAATAYRPEAKSTGDHIRARLGEGFTETDLITVVEDRCARWLVDSKMRQYLRPATLFNSEKFEGYLQAAHGGNGAGDMDRKRTFING